jgi:hypothetical protein
MSTYRYTIRNNKTFFSGGTGSIDPMISNVNTGTQQFSEYLTIYKYKPGQQTSFSTNDLITYGDSNSGVINTPNFNNVKTQVQGSAIFYTQKNKNSLLISSGTTVNPDLNFKNIIIPISNQGNAMDYSDDIGGWVDGEVKKNINPIYDGERVKYKSKNIEKEIKFLFLKSNTANNFQDSYENCGFVTEDFLKNRFKKSYFRLYFFDSNDVKTQKLLLTEDISVNGTRRSFFNFDRLFWLKNDELFLNTNNDRVVYMTARFFNAKTGKVHRFINPPIGGYGVIDINDLKQNPQWLSVPIKIFNPSNNNGRYGFEVTYNNGNDGVGLDGEITMTEYILKTT